MTKLRFPGTIQLGDVTKLDGACIPPVDIVTASSPCQDLSVAGKREGLKGERSGLFINAINIVRRMRMSTGGRQPRFFIWENVPGAFSSNGGNDFRAVLEAIAETDIPMPENNKWANTGLVQCDDSEIAWTVLDAQYMGVPQRRKRIFLVADFAKTGRCAGKILLEPTCLPGNITQGQTKEKDIAKTTKISTGSAKWGGIYDVRISSDGTVNHRAHCYKTELCRSLDTHAPDPNTNHGGPAIIYDMTHADDVVRESKGKTFTLNARMGTGGNQIPILTENIPNVAMSTMGGAEVLDNEQGEFYDKLYRGQSADSCGNGLERCACTCNGKQTVGSLCAHDGRGFNGQDVSNDKLIVETMNESI